MSLSKRSVPYALAGLLGAIAIVVLLAGVLPAFERRRALAAETAEAVAQAPAVLFVEAVAAPGTVRVTLPARLDALQQTALYAQVGGYLGPMRADLGDAVKAGQLLTEIQTPVLDRQLEQNESSRLVAQAKIELAQAKLDLATATLARLRSVGDARAISQQAIDEAAANERSDAASLAAARADLAAAEADGRRLAAQKALARIVAPFDGEVTERNYDAGALVVADKTDGSRPIFRITDRHEIRAFVDVPQTLAAAAVPGVKVTFTVRELAGRPFPSTVVRAAPALDEVTRTRLVESRLENADHALLPGMFAEAALELPRAQRTALVPGEAVLIRAGKQTIAVIDEKQSLRYLPVTIGRDTGSQVEVLGGLEPGTRVVVNLSRQLPEGIVVAPTPRAPPKKP